MTASISTVKLGVVKLPFPLSSWGLSSFHFYCQAGGCQAFISIVELGVVKLPFPSSSRRFRPSLQAALSLWMVVAPCLTVKLYSGRFLVTEPVYCEILRFAKKKTSQGRRKKRKKKHRNEKGLNRQKEKRRKMH